MFDIHQSFSIIQQISPPLQQQWGRYLFVVQQHGKLYYLKYQEQQHDEKYKSFQYELNLYPLLPQFCRLDYQIIVLDSVQDIFKTYLKFDFNQNFGLILPYAQTSFLSQVPYINKVKQQILQLCKLLYDFHQAGFVHGDLKPQHIVSQQNELYFIDFEQVQSLWVSAPELSSTATLRYMSPELFYTAQKNKQSDIYALGVILYEWLAQKRLNAKSYNEWFYLHQTGWTIELEQSYHRFSPILAMMLAPANQRVGSLIDVIEYIEYEFVDEYLVT